MKESTPSQSIDSKPNYKRWGKYSDVSIFYIKRKVNKDVYFQCKVCMHLFKSCITEDGVSTLKYHMEDCEMRKRKTKIAKQMLAAAVIQHDLPSSFVEFEGFRTFMKYLSPDLPCFSRKTAVSNINKLYLKEKAKLKQVLANTKHRVSLTVDVWTSCTNEYYICLAARFIDADWKLNCKILNFDRMDSPNIEGNGLAAKIIEFLMEWGIHDKVFSLTSNNALRNDTMQDILKNQLLVGNNLLCGGEFFRGSCFGDTLNLVVQNGLKLCHDVLFKIRESLNYLKGSESRRKRFAKCVSQFSDIDSSVDLRMDVRNSWKSTYLMLGTAIKYRKAFASFQLVDLDYDSIWCPTNEEWNRGEKLREFLEPFYALYNLICDSSSPIAYLFMQVFEIEKHLKEKFSSDDIMISGLCGSVIEKFDKYWNEYTMMLGFGVILHPKLKLVGLEFFYSQVESDPIKCQEKISLVKSSLYKLFEEYANARKSSAPPPRSSGNRRKDSFAEYNRQCMEEENAGKSELDRYLEEAEAWYLKYDSDMFECWQSERYRWPVLALMASDVWATPITTVASESGFCIGAHMLTKYRNCTVPENIQDLICTRNWLHGFESKDADCLRIKTSLSEEGSNDRECVDDDCLRSKTALSDDGPKSVDCDCDCDCLRSKTALDC